MTFSADTHPDPVINRMFIQLLDALCTWERNTGSHNVLVFREGDTTIRAADGKPNIPEDVSDELFLGSYAF